MPLRGKIRVRGGHEGGPPWWDWCPYNRPRKPASSLCSPCEDVRKMQLLLGNQICWRLESLQNRERETSVVLPLSLRGTLLQQPCWPTRLVPNPVPLPQAVAYQSGPNAYPIHGLGQKRKVGCDCFKYICKSSHSSHIPAINKWGLLPPPSAFNSSMPS